MSKKTIKKAKKLVNYNLNNYLYYRSLRLWTNAKEWQGFSKLLDKQAEFSIGDSEKIEGFLSELGIDIEYDKLDKIEKNIDNLDDIVKMVLKTEEELLKEYEEVVSLAREEEEIELEIFFSGLAMNQKKVVSYIKPLTIRMNRINGSINGLYIFNGELYNI